ncbi:MAG TPA: hypothetical protein VGM05_27440 [Planctomycetaceae bacterium]|jgi:hypothetical protein
MSTTNESTTTDEVVREVRNIKEQLAQAFDFDIDRILADAREKQQHGGQNVLSPPVGRGQANRSK